MTIFLRPQEDIRLLAFRLIGVLIVAMFEKKGAGSSFLGTSKATAEFQRVEKIKVNHVFSVMIESVTTFPFTDAVRATLFDILLGEAGPKQVISIFLISILILRKLPSSCFRLRISAVFCFVTFSWHFIWIY